MKGEPSVAAISGSAVREEPAAPPHLTPGSQSSPPAAVSFLHHSRHHHAGLLRRLSRYASRVVPLGAIREHETRILPEGDAGAGAAAPTSYGATMDGTNDLQGGGSSRGARRRRNAEGAKDGTSSPRGDNIPVCHLARSDSYERAISRNLATSSRESFTKLPAPAKRTKARAPSRPSSRKKSNVSDVSRSSNTSNESNTAGTHTGLAGGESRADPPSPGEALRGALVPPTAAPRYSLKKSLDQPEEGGGGSEYPYLREMKERLLLSRDPPLASMDESSPHDAADNQVLEVHHTPVGTVVKLNADGYGSHTSPTHRAESFYTGTLESRRGLEYYPKNAKTSTFITLSLLYATLLVVVCLGFVLSEVLTHNVPLYYYEAFFTYLYGISILFLLYVFCYLLSGSAREKKPKKPQVFMGHHSGQYNVSEYEYYAYNEKVRQPEGVPDGSPTQEKLTSSSSCSKPRKHKTSDNEHSHGSFFLRIGAIAFGLGTMIYNGLEFGVFFEIPTSSPCYQILRGVNPLLQLVFTFMQMYFVFMNARLNIHKFKFLARFGLMHIVATNLCVWVRTLVRESLKEINEFKVSQGQRGEDYMILEGIRRALANRGLLAPNRYLYNLDEFVEMQEINETLQQESSWVTEEDIVNRTCGRVEIMGSIVSDSAPYLYPFIIEYSLIGASVLYIMWKHIGRNPRFVYDPEVAGDGMSVVSRRCHSRVDCVGASKGLFCGLLVLVASLICLILFFVLVNRDELKMLAIYLADCSHCGIMFFSIIAMFIGFFRVRQLKFHGEREEELDDILLMVSAFGLFAYAVFSAVAGSLSAYTKEPNLLVMVTGILSVLQVIIQMVFIKDTQRRQVSLPEHERTKPGRQVVTFLLICNLTMWVIYTFETQKVEANPVQLEFFGDLPWTILLRCTLPLAIFHRFHSTVVLAAIWKNSYKTRIE
ncbi:proton channel OtopLc-like isoform X3 [Penaeus chinensis]|uniref:proton channel OtopLc-like isoform X3 n=1 Tax=Penaeus chinensis TaxID=139456 RepID=UPI001FB82BAC|nr:proton channel OtopLc-like isoform X3 [Penaeus chinensis]